MINTISLENFRCFRSASLRLGALTAIVGPNASGKTGLLKALVEPSTVSPARDIWRRGKGNIELVWRGDHGEHRLTWQQSVLGVFGNSGEFPYFGQYLHLDAVRMRDALQVQEQPLLNANGGNLANVVASMPRRVQEELAQNLARLIPSLRDVTARPGSPGTHRLVFQDRWKSDLWYEPTEVSDGTLLTLGLLTLLFQPAPVDIVAIDEPEHGLHPYLLGEMVSVLRKLATGEDGKRPLQIVVATQSAELLEFLEPDEVRFLNRNPDDGSVSIAEAPLGTELWRDAYDVHQGSLGSLWLSGGLGGIPTG